MVLFTVRDLRQALAPFSLVRRKALMYCLETHTRPEDILTLRWQVVFRQTLSEFAKQIVRSLPRHLRLDYVFWEYMPGTGIASPLFSLEKDLLEQSALTFDLLQHCYDNMTPIDEDADLALFVEAIREALVVK